MLQLGLFHLADSVLPCKHGISLHLPHILQEDIGGQLFLAVFLIGQHSLDVFEVSLVDNVDQRVIFGVEIEANLAVCTISGGDVDGNVSVAVIRRELQVCACLVVHSVTSKVDGHCHLVFLLA